jgi:hypothetical protein
MTVLDERDSGRRSVLLVLCGALLLLMQPTDSVAQTGKFTGTGKIIAVLAETKMFPGDKPGHEVTMQSRLDTVTSSDPLFAGGGQAAAVNVNDLMAGTGTTRGWRVTTYSSGDKVFSSVEGTVKATAKAAGPPEVTFEGKFWYTGGTGKFEGITGGGTYKNTLTPGANYEFEGQYTLKR